MSKGLIIAAPASGTGKTSLTLGLLHALKNKGQNVHGFKCGPDYIDPAFHTLATGHPSYNLDAWSMSEAMIAAHISYAKDADLIIAEGSMGLFDGGAPSHYNRTGASADIAQMTGWPVVLIINVSGQAQSAAAIGQGFANFNKNVKVAGVVLNQVSSARHENLIRQAFDECGLPVLGALPKNSELVLPERHLGLVQAQELGDAPHAIAALGDFIAHHADIDAIAKLASPTRLSPSLHANTLPPAPANHIAIARDAAFSFIYPHHLKAWRDQGAEISFFSPLNDEKPNENAQFVWLPGGYPELHAEKLSNAHNFKNSLREFARSKRVHGECGGYMTLGKTLIDKDGNSHDMVGLLDLVTSFAKRKMNLGYRVAHLNQPLFKGLSTSLHGHEFHYSSIIHHDEKPLAKVYNANGDELGQTGSRKGNVTGTYFHMIGEIN